MLIIIFFIGFHLHCLNRLLMLRTLRTRPQQLLAIMWPLQRLLKRIRPLQLPRQQFLRLTRPSQGMWIHNDDFEWNEYDFFLFMCKIINFFLSLFRQLSTYARDYAEPYLSHGIGPVTGYSVSAKFLLTIFIINLVCFLLLFIYFFFFSLTLSGVSLSKCVQSL